MLTNMTAGKDSSTVGPQPAPSDDIAMYTTVAARRQQWDNMLWQVPTLSLTAQAFLFTIALGHESSRTARVIACLLSIVMTVLSMHLMSRHRQAEHTDAHWLETYEKAKFGRSWHGRAWAEVRNQEPGGGFLTRFKGFEVWMGGLSIFGIAAVVVLVLTLAQTDVLQ